MNRLSMNHGMAVSCPLKDALQTISGTLHPAFDQLIGAGVSARLCITCSLTVRDFLAELGFRSRTVSVGFMIWASERGVDLHSIGIGMAGILAAQGAAVTNYRHDGWDGHMVTLVSDSQGTVLVDPTLMQARRPAWPDLPAMIATDALPPAARPRYLDHPVLATTDDRDDARGYAVRMMWIANPRNKAWRGSPAALMPERREVLSRMLQVHAELGRTSSP